MLVGQGRLILRDGTFVALNYYLATLKDRTRRHGCLIGDLSKIDTEEFAYQLRYLPLDRAEFTLLVTTFSDKQLTFVSDAVSVDPEHKDRQAG